MFHLLIQSGILPFDVHCLLQQFCSLLGAQSTMEKQFLLAVDNDMPGIAGIADLRECSKIWLQVKKGFQAIPKFV